MVGTQKQAINWLLEQNKDKQYEVKEHSEKRGLKANNYYWELVNQLANALRISKEELTSPFYPFLNYLCILCNV